VQTTQKEHVTVKAINEYNPEQRLTIFY